MRFWTLLYIVICLSVSAQNDSTKQYYLPYKSGDLWGYIDTNGNELLPTIYQQVGGFVDGYAFIKKDGKVGVFNTDFETIIPFEYQKIVVLGGGYFGLEKDSLLQLYHISDSIYNTNRYRDIKWIGKNFFAQNQGSGWQLIDVEGNLLNNDVFDEIKFLKDSIHLLTKKDGFQGLLDTFGRELVECVYNHVGLLRGHNMAVYYKSNKVFYYHFKRDIASQEDLYGVQPLNNRYCTFKTPEGQKLFDTKEGFYVLEKSYGFSIKDSNFIEYGLDNKVGLISQKDGRVIMPPEYDGMVDIFDDKVIVENNKLFGVIDLEGKVRIPVKYKALSMPNNLGFHACQIGSKFGVIDSNGKPVIKMRYESVNLSNFSAFVKKDSLMYLIDFDEKGNIIDRNQFSGYVELSSEYILMNASSGVVRRRRGSSLTDSLGNFWWKDPTCKLWGIMSPDSILLMEPQFKRVSPVGFTRFTLIPMDGIKDLAYNRFSMESSYSYKIVDLRSAKMASNKIYTYVHRKDILDGNKILRVKDEFGQPKLLQKLGGNYVPHLKNISFIEYEDTACFRIAFNGKLRLEKNSFKESLGDLRMYFRFLSPEIPQEFDGFDFGFEEAEFGVLNVDGTWKEKPDFQFVRKVLNGQTIIKKNDKWGVNDSGKVVIPACFDYVQKMYGSNTYKLISESNKRGLLNADGVSVLDQKYRSVFPMTDNLFKVRKGKYGVINSLGEEIVPLQMKKVISINDGVIQALDKKGNRYFTLEGDSLDIPLAKVAKAYGNGRVFLKERGRYKMYDREGNSLEHKAFKNVEPFKYEVTGANITKKWFFIDSMANKVGMQTYNRILPFNESGFALARKGKRLNVIDSLGKVLFNGINRNSYLKGTLLVKRNGGFITLINLITKEEIISKIEAVGAISNDQIAVRKNSKWGLIDHSGNWIIPAQYSAIRPFSEGKAVVKQKRLYGVIDTGNKLLLNCSYVSITDFSDGRAWALMENGDYMLLDENCSPVFKRDYQEVQPFKNGFAIIKRSGEYGTIDKKGFMVIPNNYEYLASKDNKTFVCTDKAVFQIGTTKGNIIEGEGFQQTSQFEDSNVFLVEKFGRIGYLKKDGSWLKTVPD